MPPTDFEQLTCSDKQQVLWLSKHYHKIVWKFGLGKYEDADKLIRSALKDIDLIYVKGLQKQNWIFPFLDKCIKFSNLENMCIHFKLATYFHPYKFVYFHDGICSVFSVYKIINLFPKLID